ncbi:MAG: zf-HC2 domain-containing protein [Candidatus Delongbacteria bacterium]|jgi:hypothetical protein|nr:zf-HC2 domain-containing protein [Candidatus Delongbacteria bacterium]
MNCGKYKNMMPEYISGELEDNDRAELTAHLEECAECRSDLETEIALLAFTAEEIYDIPDGLNSAILSKLPVRKPSFRINFMRYAVAASFFFILIMSYLIFDIDPEPVSFAEVQTEKNASNYTSSYVIGSEYDELISYNSELYDDDKWVSDETGIFDSESDLINDILTLEELESYDSYLSSL